MSYLFYNPSNSTVCSTSNNSIAAVQTSPFPMNLLLKQTTGFKREHANERSTDTAARITCGTSRPASTCKQPAIHLQCPRLTLQPPPSHIRDKPAYICNLRDLTPAHKRGNPEITVTATALYKCYFCPSCPGPTP